MDEYLLSFPKQSMQSRTKKLVDLVQNLLQEGPQQGEGSLAFGAFTRLMKDKKVSNFIYFSLFLSPVNILKGKKKKRSQ